MGTADRGFGTADRNFDTADTANKQGLQSDLADSAIRFAVVFVGLRRVNTNSLLHLKAAVATSFPAEAVLSMAEGM